MVAECSAALQLWWDGIGQHLRPAGKAATAASISQAARAAMNGTYPGAPGKSPSRFGLGTFAVARRDHAPSVLISDLKIPSVPGLLDVRPGGPGSKARLMAELLLYPPTPPFLIIAWSKRTDTPDRLVLNLDPNFIAFSGAESTVYNRHRLLAWQRVVGDIPTPKLRDYVRLRWLQLRNPKAAEQEDNKARRLKLEALYPHIARIADGGLPQHTAPELDAMNWIQTLSNSSDATTNSGELLGETHAL
jgi:hypothetical protein